MEKYIIETPRFYLEQISLKHLDGLFLLESNPNVYKYLSSFDPETGENLYPPKTSKEQLYPVIDHLQKQYEETGMGRLAIISKETGEFIGWNGIKLEKEVRPQEYYDIGYRIREEFWGQGIATETGLACMKYGKETLKLPAINAAAVKGNLASDRVLHKLGMERLEEFVFEGDECWFYG